MSNIVRTGQLVGPTPDYWSGSGLTNQTVSSGLVPGVVSVWYQLDGVSTGGGGATGCQLFSVIVVLNFHLHQQ